MQYSREYEEEEEGPDSYYNTPSKLKQGHGNTPQQYNTGKLR